MFKFPWVLCKNIAPHGKYQIQNCEQQPRLCWSLHCWVPFVEASILLWCEVSPLLWSLWRGLPWQQGTVPRVRAAQSLLQHFDDCIMCWLCVSGELLGTEQSMAVRSCVLYACSVWVLKPTFPHLILTAIVEVFSSVAVMQFCGFINTCRFITAEQFCILFLGTWISWSRFLFCWCLLLLRL